MTASMTLAFDLEAPDLDLEGSFDHQRGLVGEGPRCWGRRSIAAGDRSIAAQRLDLKK